MTEPSSQRAEESVLGALMRSENARLEILTGALAVDHFYFRPYRRAFAAILERFYADDPIDPLTIAEEVGPQVASDWKVSEREAVDRLVSFAAVDPSNTVTVREHAEIVKRRHDYRELLRVASVAVASATEQGQPPEEIAGVLAAAATRIVTGAMLDNELLTYTDLGRRWVQMQREEIAARQAGVELGAIFGIEPVDDFVKGLRPTELLIMGSAPGAGKHLSLDTPLPTPMGWTTMGDVRSGDWLYDDRGLPTRVMGTSDVSHVEEVYRVRFDDGSEVKASGTHLWVVSTRRARTKVYHQNGDWRRGRRDRPADPLAVEVVTTAAMATSVRVEGVARANYAIRIAEPLTGVEQDLLVDPYVLGVWLAEGDKSDGQVTLGDVEILTRLQERWPSLRATTNMNRKDSRKFSSLTVRLYGLKPLLRELGVLGDKHIPSHYLRASIEQRKDLLAGICDGDGWCNKGGACEVVTVIPRLRDDLRELVTSLGCAPRVRHGRAKLNGRDMGPKWTLTFKSSFCPFWLSRKAAGWSPPQRFDTRFVVAVDSIPSEPVKCLAVDAASRLYLCGESMIPTHNTSLAMAMMRGFALRQMRKPPDRRVGVLFLSLEMGQKNIGDRFAQMEARIEGERLRTGTVLPNELMGIAKRWASHRDLPIVTNFSGELRTSQLKALCIESIRKHGTGLVIIDHFRLIRPDGRFDNKNDADEEVAKFLKVLAKDLNLAVICLAHTTKHEDKRPRMDDLRGSKMISAFADIVMFLFSEWAAASREEREQREYDPSQLELIFDKVRSAAPGMTDLHIDMSTMTIID